MPAPRITMRQIKEVLRLKLECGLSHSQIAGALNLSAGAISKYARLASRAGLGWAELTAMGEAQIQARLMPPRDAQATSSRIEPDYPRVHQELSRKGVTLQLLWEEYAQAQGAPAYRYSQFCHRYAQFCAGLKRSMRQTHRAGEKLFADYAGQTLPIVDALSGEVSKASIFVAVLGASNYTFACATARQGMADWLEGFSLALRFIGGVPALIVPDNPRALVSKADRYEPVLNASVVDFAQHHRCVVLPARPYKPQDKAKAEVAVQIVERWILARVRHRRFFSLTELNTAIALLVEELNARPFKKLPGCRREAFEHLDRPALNPLPSTPYEFAQFKHCRVNIDYHVEIDGHYYSVPHALARQRVQARITARTVEVLFQGKRIASHARSARRGTHTTVAEHMPASHRAHLEWTPGKLIHWATRIGPASERLVRHLLITKAHPEQGYRACLGLLALARTYGEIRLEAGCQRALHIGAPTRGSVASILKAGLDQCPAATPPQTELPLPTHENLRGPSYYH
ncbi:MAG: IS21 family transposase [Burkholderiales bacterium]